MNNKNKGFILWFTGFSQSGKTTTANKVCEILKDRGVETQKLDGDIIREDLSQGLGFDKTGKDENIRRAGFVAKMLSDNGVNIVASFISPYKEARDKIRNKTENFIEIFCNCPLDVCEQRDIKGWYIKARKNEIQNFTGISDPYEEPENPEIRINTNQDSVEQCAQKIISYLEENQIISKPRPKKEKKIGIVGVGMVGGALKNYFEKQEAWLFIYDKGKDLGSMNEINQADIIFICVPTPFDKEKQSFDLTYVEEVCGNIEGEKIIVIKSTVVPGTTQKLQEKYSQHKFLFNPEFLTEITAEQDMNYPDRQIIGYTDKSFTVAGELMQLLPLAPFEKIVPAFIAEFCKYGGNTWFSVKVSKNNEFYDLFKIFGGSYEDFKSLINCMAADKRIGRSHLEVIHKGYRGYGDMRVSKCLPKDTKALLKFASDLNVKMPVLEAADRYNDELFDKQNTQHINESKRNNCIPGGDN